MAYHVEAGVGGLDRPRKLALDLNDHKIGFRVCTKFTDEFHKTISLMLACHGMVAIQRLKFSNPLFARETPLGDPVDPEVKNRQTSSFSCFVASPSDVGSSFRKKPAIIVMFEKTG